MHKNDVGCYSCECRAYSAGPWIVLLLCRLPFLLPRVTRYQRLRSPYTGGAPQCMSVALHVKSELTISSIKRVHYSSTSLFATRACSTGSYCLLSAETSAHSSSIQTGLPCLTTAFQADRVKQIRAAVNSSAYSLQTSLAFRLVHQTVHFEMVSGLVRFCVHA